MKKFKQLFEADAADYKVMQKPDDDMQVKGYKPRSKGEEEFLKAHKVFKTSHPVALDHQFDGTGSKKAPSGEDHDGHHMKGESPVLTYKAFMQLGGYGQSAARSADKSQGDKAPQKVKEEVEIEEDIYGQDGRTKPMGSSGPTSHSTHSSGHSGSYAQSLDKKIAARKRREAEELRGKTPEQQEKIRKRHRDERRARRAAAFKKAESVENKESVEHIDEAFKKGMLKLKDGKTVKVDEATAKALNNAMSQLNPSNKKRMSAETLKDKKSFESMVKFAKMGG